MLREVAVEVREDEIPVGGGKVPAKGETFYLVDRGLCIIIYQILVLS